MSKPNPSQGRLGRVPLWARIALVAVLLVLVAALVLPYFLDVDRYRTLLASVLEAKTGRKVRLGKIRARLLPSVGFVIEEFKLSEPPGFAEGDFLSAEAIRGHLAWGALLRREVELTSLELVHPRLVLFEDEHGQTNYTFGGRPGRLSEEVAGSRMAESAPGMQLAEIESIELTDAEVIVARVVGRRRTWVPSLRLLGLRAKLRHVTLDPVDPKRWEADADLGGVRLELPAWKVPFEFRSGRLTLRGGRIDSEFRLTFAKLAEWQGRVRVADLARPTAEFELNATQLDAEQLIAARAEAPPSWPEHPKASELVARGRLGVERMLWPPYAAHNLTAEVRIFSDRIELWPVTVGLYGGTIQVSARAVRTQSPERFSANVQVRNVDVGKMLAAEPAARGKLSGTGELNLQLFGSLGGAWRNALAGTGDLTIRQGRLAGLSSGGAAESVAQLLGLAGETPFQQIRGDLEIRRARVVSRQIHLDSPRGIVDLSGSCGLDGTLDYQGQATLASGSAAGQGATESIAGLLGSVLQRNVKQAKLQFAVRGTLSDPKVLPGRGLPQIEMQPPGTTAPPKKGSILDIFRRP